jgi:hypothetical protein
MKRSLELVNPVDASIAIVRCGSSTMLRTELSPAEQFNAENPLNIESFELSFVSDHARKLLNQLLKIEPYPGDQTEYPIPLQCGETFAFCHVAKVFQDTGLASLVQDLRVQATILGKYMGKDIKLELELLIDITELVPGDTPIQGISVECRLAPEHVLLSVPFAVEFAICNHDLSGGEGREFTAKFPVASGQSLVALESEVALGTLGPGEIRTFSVMYLALKTGRNSINDLCIVDYSDGSEYTLGQIVEVYVFNDQKDNTVLR